MPRSLTLAALLLLAAQAHAVIVRGRVTTQLGVPLAAAHVQLILLDGGTRSVADTVSGFDGGYEIRSGYSGRFLLLTAPSVLAVAYAPQIGNPFYAGVATTLHIDIALDANAIARQDTQVTTLTDLPLRQLASPPAQIPADRLLTLATPLDELAVIPSANVVQYGQAGTPATLYLRGAPVTRTTIDGVSAEDLGGNFNLGTLTTSGLASREPAPAIELAPGAAPLNVLDAQAGTLALHAPEGATSHPVLTYQGDAGNLSTIRNEAILTLAHRRTDALLAYSRLNTDNDLPAARLHLITSAANLGYHISGTTSLRATLRDDVSATPLPVPFAFYGLQPAGKDAAQNLYASGTFDTRAFGDWHNLLRFGMARKRAQDFNFLTPSVGLPVVITGANGFSASGIASFPISPAREDFVTNRDEFSYQTDYPFSHVIAAVVTARYADERAADLTSTIRQTAERHQLSVAAGFTGEIRNRLFYQAAAFIDTGTLLGLRGAPSLGLTYAPVRPGPRRFRGTSIHLTAATGIREPSLAEQLATPVNPVAPRSRTFDVSVDQDIVSRKLSVHSGYFHNQFAHESETLALAPLTLSSALAYRTQGSETSVRYQPTAHFIVEGGYTYLASLVEQSAATAVYNPTQPALPVGALTALPGARPFHRPPDTGYILARFTGSSLTAGIKTSFASTSDSSTNLYLNKNLLLPNRNLSPGYASMDADMAFRITGHITLYSELDNLLDQRHIAPIGYLSTPFSARLGVRIRIGKE